MTIEQLKYFIDVCETRNMTLSAAKFYISPQGLSKSLKSLQTELHTELLKFSKGKIELTEEGIVYYTKIKDLVLRIDDINKEVQNERSIKISVAVSSYAYKIVASVLEDYQKEHPEHLLLIAEYPDKAAEQKLSENKVDLAFISGPVFDKDLSWKTIAEENDYLCVPEHHPLASKSSIHFSDIQDQPFVCMNEDFKINECYTSHMHRLSCSPKIVFSTSSLEAIEHYLESHTAFTMGNPQYSISVQGYVKIPMKEKNKWKLHAAVHQSCSSPAVLELFSYITSHTENLKIS